MEAQTNRPCEFHEKNGQHKVSSEYALYYQEAHFPRNFLLRTVR
jgi:hypothetical protein